MKKLSRSAVKGLVCSLCLGAALLGGSGCDKEMLGLVDELLGAVAGGQGAGSGSGNNRPVQEHQDASGLVEVMPDLSELAITE